ncbi:hypothetical protein D917_04573 [Trichinella nativa]|uniref:Uncharacterized protein n=1 Tax=Trichinella nativa TaxID=6335 RepID=A0A1Y3E5C1_9BILA|nr:hypothetical protein D917_04573 [Trichinella nativa]
MVQKRFCTKIDTPVKLQVVKSRLIESNVMRESSANLRVSCGWSTTAAGVTREPPLPIPSSMGILNY